MASTGGGSQYGDDDPEDNLGASLEALLSSSDDGDEYQEGEFDGMLDDSGTSGHSDAYHEDDIDSRFDELDSSEYSDTDLNDDDDAGLEELFDEASKLRNAAISTVKQATKSLNKHFRASEEVPTDAPKIPGITSGHEADTKIATNTPTATNSTLNTTITTNTFLADPQTNCDLMRLPPELRNNIYSLVFDQEELHHAKDNENAPPKHDMVDLQHKPRNSLVATCRLFHNEANGIFIQAQRDFWGKGTFTIYMADHGVRPHPAIVDFPTKHCNEQIDHISRIEMDVYNDYLGAMGNHFGFALTADTSLKWGSWRIEPMSTDPFTRRAERILITKLASHRKDALASDKLHQTRQRLRKDFYRAALEPGYDYLPYDEDEQYKNERRIRDAEVAAIAAKFDRSLTSMKRLDLMLIIERCCAEYWVTW